MSAPVGPTTVNQMVNAPGIPFIPVTVGSAGGVLNNFSITTLDGNVLGLIAMGYSAYSPDPTKRHNLVEDGRLAFGVRSGNDRYRVHPASATILDADGVTNLTFLGLLLIREVNAFNVGGGLSTTKQFIAFDSLDTVATIQFKGGTAT